jgi:hypothetical protein
MGRTFLFCGAGGRASGDGELPVLEFAGKLTQQRVGKDEERYEAY